MSEYLVEQINLANEKVMSAIALQEVGPVTFTLPALQPGMQFRLYDVPASLNCSGEFIKWHPPLKVVGYLCEADLPDEPHITQPCNSVQPPR